jgi:hypothetical protein
MCQWINPNFVNMFMLHFTVASDYGDVQNMNFVYV